MSGIHAILRFDRTVADLDRTEAFYRDLLGFTRETPPESLPAAEADALGVAGRRLVMRLGEQRVGFLAPDTLGAPYPAEADAADPVFQHLAIVVRDMAAAYARLAGEKPISREGPQILPPETGRVSAYKFRDPDGHPLELIHFPGGPAAERWADAPGLFLGIDHSAITVSDAEAAVGFFTGPLGLAVAERGLNRGPEQARLDGLDDPVVDVIALTPPEPAPHVELLHYRHPPVPHPSAAYGPADRASTRFVVSTAHPRGLAETLSRLGYPVRLSGDGSACFLLGPDRHGILALQRG